MIGFLLARLLRVLADHETPVRDLNLHRNSERNFGALGAAIRNIDDDPATRDPRMLSLQRSCAVANEGIECRRTLDTFVSDLKRFLHGYP
jgi:hypothetical protein